MSDQDQNGGAAIRTPPYVAFKTFGTLIEDLNEHGIPSVIDRSVLRRFSGGVGSQLISALKALRLIDESNRPTPQLPLLVQAHGTDGYKDAVATVLRDAYPYLANLDLTTATPTQFADAFRVTGAKEDVLRKSRTFYLHAAQFAGVPIGSRLTSGSAPRTTAPRRKQANPKPKGSVPTPPPAPPPSPPPGQSGTGKALEYQLVDLLKDEGIAQPEVDAVFVIVRYLAKKAAGQ